MTSLYLIIAFALLYAWKKTRQFAIYFLPWLIFAVTYDSMRFYPNYLVNDINWFLYLEKKASNNVSFFKNFVLEILTYYNARGLYGQFRLTGY